VNQETALGLVNNANAGSGMVQAAEEPATQIQGESVISERLVARVRGIETPRLIVFSLVLCALHIG
jgi:hypothetical protein